MFKTKEQLKKRSERILPSVWEAVSRGRYLGRSHPVRAAGLSARDSSAWEHTALSHTAPRQLRRHPLISSTHTGVYSISPVIRAYAHQPVETESVSTAVVAPTFVAPTPTVLTPLSRIRAALTWGGTVHRRLSVEVAADGRDGWHAVMRQLCHVAASGHARHGSVTTREQPPVLHLRATRTKNRKISDGRCRGLPNPRSPLVWPRLGWQTQCWTFSPADDTMEHPRGHEQVCMVGHVCAGELVKTSAQSAAGRGISCPRGSYALWGVVKLMRQPRRALTSRRAPAPSSEPRAPASPAPSTL